MDIDDIGVCPVCGRTVPLLGGRICYHRSSKSHRLCKGGGDRPEQKANDVPHKPMSQEELTHIQERAGYPIHNEAEAFEFLRLENARKDVEGR